jgi:prepilin-type N-terminal cleavage/methylation domain-containing protein
MRRDPASRPARRPRGFTLIELMAVCALLGAVLLLVPPRLDGFGDKTRLDSSANVLVSVLTAAREQAVIDGHEVILQYRLGSIRDREKTGSFRYIVANEQRETPDKLLKPGEAPPERTERPTPTSPEEEWIETPWRDFSAGVILSGYSQDRGQWAQYRNDDDMISVSFFPDGSVKPVHALRLTSVDLDSSVPRVMTILINGLTSAVTVTLGEADLPETRDASEFK